MLPPGESLHRATQTAQTDLVPEYNQTCCVLLLSASDSAADQHISQMRRMLDFMSLSSANPQTVPLK